mmetsp:Transcript_23718/g.34963  ORF Transcript_23718/g.34963 Transcript_23718/m.34963 type:complete len:82 (+) Transcript_23718:4020-4265(+)
MYWHFSRNTTFETNFIGITTAIGNKEKVVSMWPNEKDWRKKASRYFLFAHQILNKFGLQCKGHYFWQMLPTAKVTKKLLYP